MADLVSISEAAKTVGLSRSRLSKLIKKYDLAKIAEGGAFLVDVGSVLSLVDDLKASGEVRCFGFQSKEIVESADEVEDRRLDKIEARLTAIEAGRSEGRSLPAAVPSGAGLLGFVRDAFRAWA